MSNNDDLIRELIQISREYEEADQSILKALLLIAGCWITSLIVILVGDVNLQSKWALFIIIVNLGSLIYLVYEVVNNALSLRSNVQKVGAMLSYLTQRDVSNPLD